jgi:predicted AlkP superfamily phosphohydrolase/phosphomutase
MKACLYSGRDIRVKTFWDVVSASGAQVGVVNWWHSWPALPVNGFVVSDRMFHWRTAASGVAAQPEQSLTYPDELLDEVREMATPPQEVTAEQLRRFVDMTEDELAGLVAAEYAHHELSGELRFLVALDTSCWRVFEHCLDTQPDLKVAAVYLRGVDIAMHCAFRFMPSADRVEADAEDRRKFGRVVPEAYRVADERVGRMMDRMGPQDTLIVLSDHGFAFQEKRGEYGHARGRPPGVFCACGPEFAAGREVTGATVYDFAPTLMRVLGFPPAADMRGRCLEELLADDWIRDHPLLPPVPTYGPREARHDFAPPSEKVDEQVAEHLRALGYLE